MSPYGDVALAKTLDYSTHTLGNASFFVYALLSSGDIPWLPAGYVPLLMGRGALPSTEFMSRDDQLAYSNHKIFLYF